MAELVQTPTSLQTGDAAVVVRSGSPANVTLGGAAARDVGTAAGDVAAGNRGIPAGGATGDVLVKTSSTDYAVTWSAGGGGGGDGITELAADLSPQLGGDLDLNGNFILGMVIGTDIQAWSSVLDATTASFTTTLKTKLDALPDSATLSSTLGAKAPLASPTFTGTPAAPTATSGANTTQLANTAWVQSEIASALPSGAEMLTTIGATFSDDGALVVTSGSIGIEEVVLSTGAANRFMTLDALGAYKEATYAEAQELLYPGTAAIADDLGKVTVTVEVFAEGETIVTGDGAARWPIPALYDGWRVGAVEAKNVTAGSGGSPLNIQIWDTDGSGADVLSTPLTIDLGENWSGTAATPAAINAANAVLAAGAWLRFDVDTVPSTPPDGLYVTVTLYPPAA